MLYFFFSLHQSCSTKLSTVVGFCFFIDSNSSAPISSFGTSCFRLPSLWRIAVTLGLNSPLQSLCMLFLLPGEDYAGRNLLNGVKIVSDNESAPLILYICLRYPDSNVFTKKVPHSTHQGFLSVLRWWPAWPQPPA